MISEDKASPTHAHSLARNFSLVLLPRSKIVPCRYRSLLTHSRSDDALQYRKSFSLRNSGNLESNRPDRSARQFHFNHGKNSGCPFHISSDNRFCAVTCAPILSRLCRISYGIPRNYQMPASLSALGHV